MKPSKSPQVRITEENAKRLKEIATVEAFPGSLFKLLNLELANHLAQRTVAPRRKANAK